MFRLWWNFGEVCATCAKSARSCCIVLKLLKFSLYLVLNENFQYGHKHDLRKIMSNTIILKLWSVYCTQLCNPPRGLEIIWGLKMSKLLNLIAYSLVVYSLVQTKILVAYVRVWQSTHLELLLLTLSWCLSHLYMLVLVEIEIVMLVVTLLKFHHNLISYLAPYYMFVMY
jgi:hypothetical protein